MNRIAAGGGIERVRRPERRDQLRQRPANQQAACLARPHGLETIVVDLSERLRLRHAAQKGVAVVARCAPREAAFDHRPVKRHQAARLHQPDQQRRVVAVADEDLRLPAHHPGIEQWQQLHAAVAAARGDDSPDVRIRPRLHQVARAQLRPTGEIVVAREDGVGVDGIESELTKLVHAGVELLAGERTGRRNDGDPIARAQGGRLTKQSGPFPRQRPGAPRGRAAFAEPCRRADADAGARGSVPSSGGDARARPRRASAAAFRPRARG